MIYQQKRIRCPSCEVTFEGTISSYDEFNCPECGLNLYTPYGKEIPMYHVILPLPVNANHTTQANLLSAIREQSAGLGIAQLLTVNLVAWFEGRVEQGLSPDIMDAFVNLMAAIKEKRNEIEQLENELLLHKAMLWDMSQKLQKSDLPNEIPF